MSFSAEVFKILIASPSDVEEERKAISEVIFEWNCTNTETRKIVLLPIKWETHSAPLIIASARGAQSVLNQQILPGCDMLIGIFWSRLGTPTSESKSGTVEEIQYFMDNHKPVMIYFSSKPIEQSKLHDKQYQNLMDFKEKLMPLGLLGSYDNIDSLKRDLKQELTINIDFLKKPKNEKDIYRENYEKDGMVKSFLVKGERTREVKDKLKELGGKWIPTLAGWVFPIDRQTEIDEVIKTLRKQNH